MRSTITMVKKRLADGQVCAKCLDAQRLLDERGLAARIDEVVWADEADPASPGWALAAEHHVALAPFFIVRGEGGTRVVTSVIQLARLLAGARPGEDLPVGRADEAPSPELDALVGPRLMAHPVHRRHEDPVGDGVAALDGLP